MRALAVPDKLREHVHRKSSVRSDRVYKKRQELGVSREAFSAMIKKLNSAYTGKEEIERLSMLCNLTGMLTIIDSNLLLCDHLGYQYKRTNKKTQEESHHRDTAGMLLEELASRLDMLQSEFQDMQELQVIVLQVLEAIAAKSGAGWAGRWTGKKTAQEVPPEEEVAESEPEVSSEEVAQRAEQNLKKEI